MCVICGLSIFVCECSEADFEILDDPALTFDPYEDFDSGADSSGLEWDWYDACPEFDE